MNEAQRKLWGEKGPEWLGGIRKSMRRQVPAEVSDVTKRIMCDAMSAGLERSKDPKAEPWATECDRYWNNCSLRKTVAKMMSVGRLEPAGFDAFRGVIITSFVRGFGRGLKELAEASKQTELF